MNNIETKTMNNAPLKATEKLAPAAMPFFKPPPLKISAFTPAGLSLSIASIFMMMPIVSQATVSNIDQVTIYQGLAAVTRSLPLTGGGEETLVFSCLSPNIDSDSVSVQAPAGVNIGEVSIETLSGEQAAQCQYQTDAKVRSQQQNLANINAELEAAKLSKSYLQNLTKVTQISMDGTVAASARDIESQASAVNKRIIDLQQQHAQAQDALNQLMAGSAATTQAQVTQVSVRVASHSATPVQLHYQVRGASWQPTYQASLNTTTEQLTLTASAIIAQQTGENWLNVPLTLSTVNPSQRVGSRVPRPDRLSLYEDTPDQRRFSPPAFPEPEMAPVVVSDSADYAGGRAMPPLPSFTVSSNSKNGITEYRLPQRVSIPSDGRRVRTVLAEQSGQSSLWLRSTPEEELKAYWYASAPFLTPDWVDGELQLYRDGNYIGQSRYNYQLLKEQGIGFGADPNILVKRLGDDAKEGDSGVFNRSKRLSATETYQFTNQHSRSVPLEVLASEFISQDDNIKLTMVHTPPVSEKEWNDNKGIIAWRFDLAPKQSKVVQSSYQISYPANKEMAIN